MCIHTKLLASLFLNACYYRLFSSIFSRFRIFQAQLEDLKEDFMQVKCQAQKSDMLQMEVSCLRNEILKRDMALSDYDCQYKQLMVSNAILVHFS